MRGTKTHCLHGHAFDAANTYVDGQGYSHCRACDQARTAKYRAANREKLRARAKERWISNREQINASNQLRRSVPLALIAAAPELYEALKALLSVVYNSCGVSGYHLNGDIAEWGEFEEVAVAEDAIRKAEEAAEG